MKKSFQPGHLWPYITISLLPGFIPVLHAQVIVNSVSLNYAQHFNMLDTTTAGSSNLPEGWQIFEYGSSTTTVNGQYKGNSGTSTTGDTYSYGSPGSAERALGSLATSGNKAAYGVTFKNSTGVLITALAITCRGEQWRRGNAASDTLFCRYSTTANGVSDTPASKWITHIPLSLSTINPGTAVNSATDGNAISNYILKSDSIPVSISPGGTFILAWWDKDITSSDDGLAIDDLNITFITDGAPIPTNIYVTGKAPTGPDIPVNTTQLSISFDHMIATGNGQLNLYKNGAALPVSIPVPSPQVSISDSTAIFSNVLLEHNSHFHVHLSAGAFTKAGDTISNLAISDSTSWTFSTMDTTTPPPPVIWTGLNESFTGCTDSTTGIFVPYNITGFKTWHCSADGHGGDSAAVSMGGGVTDGISDRNTDWLISAFPFDFSAMSRPELSFWHKSRFTGQVDRSVRVSTDYQPGDPPAHATWTTLQVQDMTEDPVAEWTPIADIDLIPYKNTPFFLAFTYSCGTDGAYELSYDDIRVTDETLSASGPEYAPVGLQVIGTATGACIMMAITSGKTSVLDLNLSDMTGRNVYQKQLSVQAGKGVYPILNTGLLPGLYVLRAYNKDCYGAIKVVLQ